jgi:DNA-binding MarR family transcriptional regulator
MYNAFGQLRAPRERNALLAALELFRDLDLPRSIMAMILFLYVCENEGLTVSELAEIGGVPVAGAARLTKTLAGLVREEPMPPDAILFEVRGGADKRLKFVHLSPRGRELRDQLDALIARAAPIVAPADAQREAVGRLTG